MLTAVAAVALAACETTKPVIRPAAVPTNAVLIGGGTMDVTYVVPDNGLLYLVDGNDGQLLSTRTVKAGDDLKLDLSEQALRKQLIEAKGQRMPAEYRPQVLAYFAPDLGLVPRGARPLADSDGVIQVPAEGTIYVLDTQSRVVWAGWVRAGERLGRRDQGYEIYFIEGHQPIGSATAARPLDPAGRDPLIPLETPSLSQPPSE